MDYDNWVGRTRTFDRDDPSFWGGFPSIPASLDAVLHWPNWRWQLLQFRGIGILLHSHHFVLSGGTCMEVTCVYIKGIRVQHKIWRNDCQLLGFFLHQPSGLRMEQSVKSFTFRKEWHVNKFLHFHSFFEGYLKYLSIGK